MKTEKSADLIYTLAETWNHTKLSAFIWQLNGKPGNSVYFWVEGCEGCKVWNSALRNTFYKLNEQSMYSKFCTYHEGN